VVGKADFRVVWTARAIRVAATFFRRILEARRFMAVTCVCRATRLACAGNAREREPAK